MFNLGDKIVLPSYIDFGPVCSSLSEIRGRVRELHNSLEVLEEDNLVLGSELGNLKAELLVVQEARQWVGDLIKKLSDDIVDFVSAVCNRVLKEIFGLPLDFKIVCNISEIGTSSAKFVLTYDDRDFPVESFLGQGVYSTLSVFFSVMIAVVRDKSKYLFIDEQFGNVSTEYLPDVLDLFFEIFGRFGVTPVVISHDVRVINYLSARSGGSNLSIRDGRVRASV